jgi:hypothetical protein
MIASLPGAGVKLLFDRTTCATNATSAGPGAYVDTKGSDYATFLFWEETTGDTAIALVLQVEEGDTTSSYATFAGARGGTDFTCIAVPAATSTTGQIPYKIDVDLRGRKRYLRLKWTPGATNVTASGLAILSRNEQTRDNTTKSNTGVLYAV